MRNITITWEDLRPISDPNSDETIYEESSGFLENGWRHELDGNVSADDFMAAKRDALQNIDDMIDCKFCSSFLTLNESGTWVDENNSSYGLNRYDTKPHEHYPEKKWYEIFVDIMEQFSALETDILSWRSEYGVVDYYSGTMRQYAVHIEWDISREELELIDMEIQLRQTARKLALLNYQDQIRKAQNSK
jgi:hypothetical protein